MTHVRDHSMPPISEASRPSLLEAFVAWVARLLALIAGLKRRKVFPPNWKDCWRNLQQAEWGRAQLFALCVREVLAGRSLDTDASFTLDLDPPEDYGVCPRTARAMNQRFLQIARFQLDPNRYILRHLRRIAKRERLHLACDANGCPYRLAPMAADSAPSAEPTFAVRTLCALSLSRHAATSADGRSREIRPLAQARGPPPAFPPANRALPRQVRQRERTRLPNTRISAPHTV